MKNKSQTGSDICDSEDSEESWPRKINKLIICVGIVAFGFIIADRLKSVLSADDLPDTVEAHRPEVQQVVADIQADSTTADAESSAPSVDTDTANKPTDIENVFGARLVFVSASAPLYVVTEDNRRIDVGSNIDDNTTLSDLTNEQVILERDGNLMTISLPEPGAR